MTVCDTDLMTSHKDSFQVQRLEVVTTGRRRREIYGRRSARKARVLDQLELEIEELEASATEDELAADLAAARTSTVKSFTRKRPSRKPFPDHPPRERVVVRAPEVCACCGSGRLSKLGEGVTETLEVIPKVLDIDP